MMRMLRALVRIRTGVSLPTKHRNNKHTPNIIVITSKKWCRYENDIAEFVYLAAVFEERANESCHFCVCVCAYGIMNFGLFLEPSTIAYACARCVLIMNYDVLWKMPHSTSFATLIIYFNNISRISRVKNTDRETERKRARVWTISSIKIHIGNMIAWGDIAQSVPLPLVRLLHALNLPHLCKPNSFSMPIFSSAVLYCFSFECCCRSIIFAFFTHCFYIQFILTDDGKSW